MSNNSQTSWIINVVKALAHPPPSKAKTNMKFNSVEFITRNFTNNKLKRRSLVYLYLVSTKQKAWVIIKI